MEYQQPEFISAAALRHSIGLYAATSALIVI
jgi:hypothetical protein